MWCLILWQLVTCVDKIARLQKNLHDLPVGRKEARGPAHGPRSTQAHGPAPGPQEKGWAVGQAWAWAGPFLRIL